MRNDAVHIAGCAKRYTAACGLGNAVAFCWRRAGGDATAARCTWRTGSATRFGQPPARRDAAVAGAPRPFAEVIKDAKQLPGFLPIWQKDDRTWVEITPDMLDKPFFLSINMTAALVNADCSPV